MVSIVLVRILCSRTINPIKILLKYNLFNGKIDGSDAYYAQLPAAPTDTNDNILIFVKKVKYYCKKIEFGDKYDASHATAIATIPTELIIFIIL